MKKSKKITKKTSKAYLKKSTNVNQENLHFQEFYLLDTDRIIYVYKRNAERDISEVSNVSYEIKVKDEWITIVRYDSSHGYLHRHLAISISNPSDTPSTVGVIRKGSHPKWLTWAINDIKKRYLDYKRGFLRRSKIKDIDNG